MSLPSVGTMAREGALFVSGLDILVDYLEDKKIAEEDPDLEEKRVGGRILGKDWSLTWFKSVTIDYAVGTVQKYATHAGVVASTVWGVKNYPEGLPQENLAFVLTGIALGFAFAASYGITHLWHLHARDTKNEFYYPESNGQPDAA